MSNDADHKPENFDWVKARAECSSAVIFEKLRMLVQQDVEARNAIRHKDETFFKFLTNNNRFSASAEEPITRMSGGSVMFTLANGSIKVTDSEGKEHFVSYPTLGDDGECRLKVNDKTFDLWQIRRMALEDFFFNKMIWNP